MVRRIGHVTPVVVLRISTGPSTPRMIDSPRQMSTEYPIELVSRRANVAVISGSSVPRDDNRGPAAMVNDIAGVTAYVDPSRIAFDVCVSSPLMKWRIE